MITSAMQTAGLGGTLICPRCHQTNELYLLPEQLRALQNVETDSIGVMCRHCSCSYTTTLLELVSAGDLVRIVLSLQETLKSTASQVYGLTRELAAQKTAARDARLVPKLSPDQSRQFWTFVGLMQQKLTLNAHKGGWHNCTMTSLFSRLLEETQELQTAMHDRSARVDYEQVHWEAADVANFAMMIASLSVLDKRVASHDHAVAALDEARQEAGLPPLEMAGQ